MNILPWDITIKFLFENKDALEMLFLSIIDYLGAFAFAISGIRLASTKKFDLFGAFVVGVVTAIGGGTLRDMILGIPVSWLTSPYYFFTTLAALISTYLFRRYIVKMEYTFFLFDTIGLGLFTAVGITVTLDAGYNMFTAIILGTITGSAGGVMRDLLLNQVPLLFRKDIYAVACVIGGIVYYLCVLMNMEQIITQILTIITVTAVRFYARATKISIPIVKMIDFESCEKDN